MLLLGGCSDEEVVLSDIPGTEAVEYSETEEQSSTEVPSTEESTETHAFVYVIGAVNRPGVYEVREDSRIFEVIERAGGFR